MRDAWRMLRYSLELWRLALLLLFLGLVASAFGILSPWPIKLLVDNVLGSQALNAPVTWVAEHTFGTSKLGLLGLVLAVMVGTQVGTALLGLLQQYYAMDFGQRLVAVLRSKLFNHLQYLSLSAHEERRVGDSIYRLVQDTNAVPMLCTRVAVPLIRAVFMFAGMAWIMWNLDRVLTAVSFGAIPLMVGATVFFKGRIGRLSRASYEQGSDVFARIEQTLSNIRIVKAFAREDHEQEVFEDISNQSLQTALRVKLSESQLSVMTAFVGAAGTGAVLWIGGSRAIAGTLTVGAVLVFLAYLGSLYTGMNAMVGLAANYQRIITSGRRLFEILDLPIGVEDPRNPLPLPEVRGEVAFKDLTFGYGSQPVLHDITFRIAPGQTVSVVGPTGAGKSTLISLILRFYEADRGEILLDGVDIRRYRQRDIRSQISLVAQDSLLFDISVYENIRYGKLEATKEEIREAAQLADAAEFIRQLPQGFRTRVAEGAARLSGGQKQRLAIARAFLKDAPIVILDEPTSALDSFSEERVLSALRRLKRNRTTFIVAHRLSTAMEADVVLVLEDGRLVEIGAPEALLKAKQTFYRLFERQIGIETASTSVDADHTHGA